MMMWHILAQFATRDQLSNNQNQGVPLWVRLSVASPHSSMLRSGLSTAILNANFQQEASTSNIFWLQIANQF
jgi:hypothetical protein